MRYYAGIGSRTTPDKVLGIMYGLGALLAKEGLVLRSGGAEGADLAFEKGCDALDGKKQIFIPWKGFGQGGIVPSDVYEDEAKEIAKSIHPAWDKCKPGAKKLHTRNVNQILGEDLGHPVEFVVCWTPRGEAVGGTATAINLALKYEIPVYNLGKGNTIKEILSCI